jgi:hypothetical protein
MLYFLPLNPFRQLSGMKDVVMKYPSNGTTLCGSALLSSIQDFVNFFEVTDSG